MKYFMDDWRRMNAREPKCAQIDQYIARMKQLIN